MTAPCSACGGEWTGAGYTHAPECRIQRAARRVESARELDEMIQCNSLGTPEIRAVERWGRLMGGPDQLDEDQAFAKLSPRDQRLVTAHMKRISEVRRR